MTARQRFCDGAKAFIAGPEACPARQRHRAEQVRIDVTDSCLRQRVPLDEIEHFRIAGDRRGRERLQEAAQDSAIFQPAADEFPDDERMAKHLAGVERLHKLRVAGSKVLDPDRSIDEDQAGSTCLRGTG